MNILKKINSLRTRFALGFGILFTFFLAVAFIAIYVSSAKFREVEFYTRLKDRASTTYRLLIEVDKIDSKLLKVIDRNIPSSIATRLRVTVFQDSSVIFCNADSGQARYDAQLFTRIKEKGEINTMIGIDETYGLYKEQNGNRYFILASGYDMNGFRKMEFLKWIMIAVYFGGVVIGWLIAYLLVKRIIRPLEHLNTNVKNIDYNNLHSRLPETRQGEEVDNLSVSFNQMLSRLEKSFSFQKDFVHYASHELRTPLAAMVSVTESSMNVPMSPDQSREVMQKLLLQQQSLTNITNSLLLLSGSKARHNGYEYPLVRLDELLFRSVEITKSLYPAALIEVNLGGELSSEQLLMAPVNEPLILMAFNNLLKNAVQYSPGKQASIFIDINEKEKVMRFINPGNDFSADEKERIFTPFYRASNSDTVKGHGLGLALVKQIVELHEGSIAYAYEGGQNIFTITFH